MAQLAEHSAVNRRVPGSSPGGSEANINNNFFYNYNYKIYIYIYI